MKQKKNFAMTSIMEALFNWILTIQSWGKTNKSMYLCCYLNKRFVIFFCLNLVQCTASSRVLFNDAKVVVPHLLSLSCNFRHMCLWYFPSAKQSFSIVHSGFSLYLYSHLSHTRTKVENVFLSTHIYVHDVWHGCKI